MTNRAAGPPEPGGGRAGRDRADWISPRAPDEGLRHYAGVIGQSWRLVLACLLACVVVAGLYVALAPRTYKAQASLLVTPVDGSDENLLGLGLITASSDPTRDVSTAAAFVTDPAVARRVSRAIGGDPDQLSEAISAVPLAESSLVTITAKAGTAARAAAVANAFAQATAAERTARLQQRLNQIVPSIRTQLGQLPRNADAAGLRGRLTTLESMVGQADPTIHLELPAIEPLSPSSPRPKLSIAAGIIAGLVLGIGAAFALEAFDPRIRREETLRQMFRLPVLARIQSQTGSAGPLAPRDVTPAVHEDFRMLKASLGVHAHAAGRRSFLITGAGPDEGKSTTALNLAAALAGEGAEVIVLEADVRRPSLGAALKLRRGKGVVKVLLGDVTVVDALTTFPQLPPNLRGLLVDQHSAHVANTPIMSRFDDILDETKRLATYVVVDAPPIPEVSDALSLAEHVDDVLLVVRLGKTRRDRLANLGETLAHQGIRPVGIVLVGVEGHRDGGYYFTPPANTQRGRRRAAPAAGRR